MDKLTVISVNINTLKKALCLRDLTIAEASRRLNRNPHSVYSMLHAPIKYWNWDIAHGLSRLAGTDKWYEIKEFVEVEAQDD